MLVLLVILASVNPSLVISTVTEPSVDVFGTVTKDIINSDNVFKYKDDNDIIKTLDYEVQDKKLHSYALEARV